MNQWEAALYFYKTETPKILAEKRNEWAIIPYAWEGLISMTPIEFWLWSDIRQANVVMYPQYPVGKFFVDFANPVAKVAIECDGKEFHKDKAKDAARDEELLSMGWTVYRISGKDCRTDFDEEKMEDGYARKFIDEIAERHGLKRDNSPTKKDREHYAIPLLEHLLRTNPL